MHSSQSTAATAANAAAVASAFLRQLFAHNADANSDDLS
jgi:hypothetical protein